MRAFVQGAGALRAGFAASLLVAVTMASPAFSASRDGDDGPIIGRNFLAVQSVQGRAWSINAMVNGSYDSNFRRTPVPEAAFRTGPRIQLAAGMPVGRQQLFIGATIGRDITFGYPELNRGRYALGGGLEWRLGTRCSGVIGAEASQQLTFVTEQASLTDNIQNAKNFGVSIGCRTPTGLGVGLTVNRRIVSNASPDRRLFDLTSTIIAPNISYGSETIGQFSLSGTLNDTIYPNRLAPTIDGFVNQGVNIFQVRVGYSRTFGPRLQAAVGYSYFKSNPRPEMILAIVDNQLVSIAQPGFSGSGYDVSLSYRPSDKLGVSIEGSRNVSVTPNVGAQAVARTTVGADINYALGKALGLTFGGRVAKSDFLQSFATPDSAARISDTATRVFVGLDYSPVPLYSLAAEVAHQWRQSDPAEFNFVSTTARVTLNVNFGSN